MYNSDYHRNYYLKHKNRIKARVSKRQKEKRLEINAYHRKYRYKIRNEVLQHYGSCCKCCGESNVRFLTIDHVNNDGNNHRASLGNKQNCDIVYRWLKKNNFPEGYEVMCWNCNCGRAMNGGICPHKEPGIISYEQQYHLAF